MNMRLTFVVATAFVISGPAAAHGTRHHMHHASHHASAMHSDENIIDRCNDKRYDAKVSCLREGRGEQLNAAGSTSGAAASGMTGGSVRAHAVR